MQTVLAVAEAAMYLVGAVFLLGGDVDVLVDAVEQPQQELLCIVLHAAAILRTMPRHCRPRTATTQIYFYIYPSEITLPFDHFFATKCRLFLATTSETKSLSDFRPEVETLLLKSMLVVLK